MQQTPKWELQCEKQTTKKDSIKTRLQIPINNRDEQEINVINIPKAKAYDVGPYEKYTRAKPSKWVHIQQRATKV